MRAVALTLAALALASAGMGAASSLQLTSGLRGVVMRGPIKAVCMDDESCDAPAVGVVLEFRQAGRLVASTRTRAAGAYTIRLRPGTYSVRTTGRPVGSGLTPRLVHVPKGRLARVVFHLDTGIQ